jgi:hypothetical protein
LVIVGAHGRVVFAVVCTTTSWEGTFVGWSLDPGGRVVVRDQFLLFAFVRVHSFEVREHHVSVEGVTMRNASVLDHGVRDGVLVLTDEFAPTARADLFIWQRIASSFGGRAP